MTTKQISVLLIDDHAMFRQAMAAFVQTPTIRVVGECGDALKAVAMAEELRPDVVVLDISMPGWNGLDICQELKRRIPGVHVLIATMHRNEQYVVRALEHGASGYVLKDAAAGQLIEAIETVTSGNLYLGPGIPKTLLERVGQGIDDLYERLTPRERQVLQLIAESKKNREIAEDLGLSMKTVDVHRTRLMRKLHIHDQTTLVKYALQKGVVPPGL